MKVTVIGNGPSRASIPLEKISGITIGCNEIFEVFTPDYLCAVDYRMMKLLYNSTYTNPVYYRAKSLEVEGLKPKENWLSPSFMQHHSSGNAAISLAVSLNPTQIDLLGFDCNLGRVLRLSHVPTASIHLWVRNLINMSKKYPYIRRVVDETCLQIPEVPSITVEQYLKEFGEAEK